VDKSKVSLVVGVNEVVVVRVDLDRGKLALVDNVLVGEGAEVEPVLEADGVSGTFPQHIQLALEEAVVELFRVGHLGLIARAIGRGKDDKWLSNDGLARLGGRAEQRRVDGRPTPTQDSQAQRLGNIFQLPLGLLEGLLVGLEEQVSHGVLAERRELDVLLSLKVLDEEPVGNGRHDTGAITVTGIRTHGSPMGHVAQEVASIADDFVARLTLDVAAARSASSAM